MKQEYVVNLKGKNYPTYPGVLDAAHEKGLTSIETQLIQAPTKENEAVAIVKATVTMGDKTFVDYGDASPRNVNSFIATALIRMASTRAKGRALRDAINVGETMLEELPNTAQTSPQQTAPPPQPEEEFIESLEEDQPTLDKNHLCPTCKGLMWDNRQDKKNPKAPDFKCKDRTCVDSKGFVTAVWL